MDQITDQVVSVLNQAQGGSVMVRMDGNTHHLMGIREVSPKRGSVRPPSVEALGRKEVNDDEDQSPQRGGSGTGWRA
jgi:hypothetical protein